MSNFSYDEFAKGYIDMSKINLEIVQECFDCENEAMELGDEVIDEMGREEA